MQIKIFTSVEDSTINKSSYTELPQALQVLLHPVLTALQREGVTLVTELKGSRSTTSATLTKNGAFVRLERFLTDHPDTQKEIEAALPLLQWYMGPKFRYLGSPGTIGGGSECTTCGKSVQSGVSVCPSWRCASHANWKLVDPSYVVPTQPEWEKRGERDMARMAKAMRDNPRAKGIELHHADGSLTITLADGKTKKIRAPKRR